MNIIMHGNSWHSLKTILNVRFWETLNESGVFFRGNLVQFYANFKKQFILIKCCLEIMYEKQF